MIDLESQGRSLGLQTLTGDKPLVSQGIPLLELSDEAGLGLSAYKLLNMYLAAIDPTNRATAAVTFTVKEYADALGIPYKNVSLRELDKHLKALLSLQISQYSEEGRQLIRIAAFSYAMVRPIKIGGKQVQAITIRCQDLASHLFFDLASRRYLKYRLRYVVRMTQLNSYKLYMYLLSNQFRGSFAEPVSNLRKALHFESKYRDTRNLLRVLQEAVAEINEKTDITCQIETIADKADKRKIGKIKFSVLSKTSSAALPERESEGLAAEHSAADVTQDVVSGAMDTMASLEQMIIQEEQQREIRQSELVGLLHQAFDECRHHTTYDEQEDIIQQARVKTGKTGNDLFDYLRLVVSKANLKKTLKNPHSYLIGIINHMDL